jgi:hypothetical protein
VTKAEVIRPFLEKVMKDVLGVDDLLVWDDGTIPVRVGSAGVYLNLAQAGERAILHVYSPVLRDVAKTPALLERLNEINASSFTARAFWAGDQVLVAVDLLADALDPEEVRNAFDLVSAFADRYDGELKATFGGQTAFADDGEPANTPTTAPIDLPAPPPGTIVAKADEDDGASQGYL